MHAPNPWQTIELTPEQAAAWVAAALAAERALRQHDELLFPTPADASAIRTTAELRQAWQQWVDEAAALLRRIDPMVKSSRHVAGAYDLDFALARARYVLETPVELIQQRRDQAERGDLVTIEELRRELRAANPR